MINMDGRPSSGKDLEAINAQNRSRGLAAILITFALLIGAFFICMFLGSGGLSFERCIDGLFGNGEWGDNYIIRRIRIPRMLCVILVGAALSVGGMTMQSLFKNPMASPSVLGLSSGASFGAAMAISYGIFSFMGAYGTTAAAFIFCIGTMGLVYAVAYSKYGTSTMMLLLSGMAISALFSGLTSLIEYLAEDATLADIVFWMMGSFNRCGWNSFYLALVPIVAGLILVGINVREMNIIAMGEQQAKTLGVNVGRCRIMLILGTSLLVAGSVSISGVIGFVGLIVPHIFRMIAGPNHVVLMPLCMFGGAIFMLVMDTVAKVITVGELPVGILTSLLGAPFFLYILRSRRREIWS
ncbi:MAG: iron ABC transporter permease [Candidatus Methanomethylophilaceae archaeon]|nr:iron ABC transporter permease [Candidatus Methanomethylophilaceae archaeon]